MLDRYFDYNNPIGSLNYTSANGDTSANQYYLTMSHDFLGNQTSRGGRYWWMATGTTFSNATQFTNNKIVSGSDGGTVTTSFDNEGNTLGILQGSTQTLGPDKFDVAGRIVAEVDPAVSKYYDGDGNLVRSHNEYYLFSKVLGGKQLSIISATGTKTETSVFGNGQLLARQEIVAGVGQVKFVHRDPHNTIDYSGNETQWVDAQGTTGKAATSTYISQYQAGMFGHPDPSTYVTNTGQFYPGGGGNQKPGQSTVCYEGYVKVSCSSLNNSIRMGGIVWMRVSSQSLTGYDEESSNLLSSANSSATSRNGKPTGSSSVSRVKRVIPGDPNTMAIFNADGSILSSEGRGKDSIAYENVTVISGGGFESPAQQTGSTTSSQSLSSAISSFGPGCTIWFGGAENVKKLAADAANTYKVVAVGGAGYNNTIPNDDRTFKSFWEKKVPVGSFAAAVAYDERDRRGGNYKSIILGSGFFDSSYKNPWLSSKRADLYPSTVEGFAAFQKDALRHEWAHIFTNLTDLELANYWQLTARGYGSILTPLQASPAIQLFFKNDCRNKIQ